MRDRGYKRNDISPWRYRELKAILMQYDERKEMIKEAITLPSGVPQNGVKSGSISDYTAKQAMHIAKLQDINDKIDGVLKYFIYPDILRKCCGYDEAVKYGYEGGKNEYYQHKREFFSCLNGVLS